jgi:hypothetical protein
MGELLNQRDSRPPKLVLLGKLMSEVVLRHIPGPLLGGEVTLGDQMQG